MLYLPHSVIQIIKLFISLTDGFLGDNLSTVVFSEVEKLL